MASQGDVSAERKMKRTGGSLWAAPKTTPTNKPSPVQARADVQTIGLESIRAKEQAKAHASAVVAAVSKRPLISETHVPIPVPPRMNGLAASSKIMAAQRSWEQKRGASGGGNNTASTTPPNSGTAVKTHVPLPMIGQQRKRSEGDITGGAMPPAPKRQQFDGPISSSQPAESSSASVRAQAQRFTEEAVMKQLKDARNGSDTTSTATELVPDPKSHLPEVMMQFATSSQLLARMLQQDRDGGKSRSGENTRSTVYSPYADLPTELPEDKILLWATDDRPYDRFISPLDGSLQPGRGIIFPAGYALHTHPDLAYICPVRNCRRIFPTLYRLAQHFGARHSGRTFNDNLDGTLTETGVYSNRPTAATPATVTSRNPLPPGAEPPMTPGLPSELAKKPSRVPPGSTASQAGMTPQNPSRSSSQTAKRPTPPLATKTNPVPLPPSASENWPNSSAVLQYMHGFIAPAQSVPSRQDVAAMGLLPRLRDLPTTWLSLHRGSVIDDVNYVCVLAYLVGEDITGPEKCTRCVPELSRLAQKCIALPRDLPIPARQAFSELPTCVGCRYWSHVRGQTNKCSWSLSETLSEVGKAPAIGTAEERPGDVSTQSPEGDTRPSRQTVASTRELRSKRLGTAADTPASTGSVSGDGAEAGQVDGDIEMETWEVAPGRITDVSSSENIGYSNAYLTNTQPILVSTDVSFNVLVVKPGNSHQWASSSDTLRTCSVASGKLKVKTENQSFQLGPNGMFVIRPGQKCTVENRLYVDAVIHCTTVKDYELCY